MTRKHFFFFYSVLKPVSYTSNTVIYTSVVDGSLTKQQGNAQTRGIKASLFRERSENNDKTIIGEVRCDWWIKAERTHPLWNQTISRENSFHNRGKA